MASVLASAWGVKEEVEAENSEEVRKTFKEIEGKNINLDTGEEVEILKGDVRERKGKHTLIFRYKLNI
ncbi:hypothetical protein [Senegalia massiliensis]|uniref:Uncharacterized protein n=1 Tax=Senegalia massiliensis TaxID=1720316 RepID=A0A845QX72_9CLOT|nr:hypothetical protein [Senegalia massiliensis]NBI06740.1 hypothetical protein [Senegalia massiliensis]